MRIVMAVFLLRTYLSFLNPCISPTKLEFCKPKKLVISKIAAWKAEI